MKLPTLRRHEFFCVTRERVAEKPRNDHFVRNIWTKTPIKINFTLLHNSEHFFWWQAQMMRHHKNLCRQTQEKVGNHSFFAVKTNCNSNIRPSTPKWTTAQHILSKIERERKRKQQKLPKSAENLVNHSVACPGKNRESPSGPSRQLSTAYITL